MEDRTDLPFGTLTFTRHDDLNLRNSHSSDTKFDAEIKAQWHERMERGMFRYRMERSTWKVLEGSRNYVMVLNKNRVSNRRPPEPFFSVTDPVDPKKFNFSKVNAQEVLFRLQFLEDIGNKSEKSPLMHDGICNEMHDEIHEELHDEIHGKSSLVPPTAHVHVDETVSVVGDDSNYEDNRIIKPKNEESLTSIGLNKCEEAKVTNGCHGEKSALSAGGNKDSRCLGHHGCTGQPPVRREVKLRELGRGIDLLMINASPFEEGHLLFVPDINAVHNQTLTADTVWKTIEIMRRSGCTFRMAFNSLCAHASVNHRHVHGYYFKGNLTVETSPGIPVGEDLHTYLLPDSVFGGFGFQIDRTVGDSRALAQKIGQFIDYMHSTNTAYNLFFTHGDSFDNRSQDKATSVSNGSNSAMNGEGEENVKVIRIFLWPRLSVIGAKCMEVDFFTAVAEMAGQVFVYDEKAYSEHTEESIREILKTIALPQQELDRILEAGLHPGC